VIEALKVRSQDRERFAILGRYLAIRRREPHGVCDGRRRYNCADAGRQ
jgi:hypothetical protein